MRPRPHSHPCRHCRTPVECEGELVANDDGWPTVICRAYHLDGGQIDDTFLCEACRELEDDLCDDGEVA
jgi:hypothetical protein